MWNDVQIEVITNLRHEGDEINSIAIGLLKILFEEEEDQELLLRIGMPRETMGIPGERKTVDLGERGMKKPDISV